MELDKDQLQHINDSFQVELGRKIRRARLDTGISQAELATLLNTRQASISDLENGKRISSSAEIILLAKSLNKPIKYFFPGWVIDELIPENNSPQEEELIIHFRNLNEDDQRKFVAQIKALVDLTNITE